MAVSYGAYARIDWSNTLAQQGEGKKERAEVRTVPVTKREISVDY